MNVVLTGGAGFLGQHLIPMLAAAGMRITVLDLKPPQVPITELDQYIDRAVYGVDITDPSQLSGHFDNADVVYHLAGLVSFWRKAADALYKVNVEGTKNVVAECRKSQVGRLVHISSVAAIGYDETSSNPIDETFEFQWSTVPTKHYMRSKHLAELEVSAFGESSTRTETIIINPGLMWGPGDLTNSAKLISKLHDGKIPACPPGGTNIADVRDVARGLVLCAQGGRSGERYIFGGENVSFREIYDVIAGHLNVSAPERMLPAWALPMIRSATLLREMIARKPPALTSDNVDSAYRHRYFSSLKARSEFGWEAEISFSEMIRDSIVWLIQHGHLPYPESLVD